MNTRGVVWSENQRSRLRIQQSIQFSHRLVLVNTRKRIDLAAYRRERFLVTRSRIASKERQSREVTAAQVLNRR